MNRTASLAMLFATLIMLLSITPSSSGPPNPTDSDANLNTAGGTDALNAVTSGERNTAFGYQGLSYLTTADNSTAVGTQALVNNTSDSFNTAIGDAALALNQNGDHNTAIGSSALQFNTWGSLNTAVGANALPNNTTGSQNTATGLAALIFNTTGNDNTAGGAGSLRDNTTGNNNTASGADAILSNTTGSFNTASGSRALFINSTGTKNTGLGYEALSSSSGSRNIAIGYRAGAGLDSGNNNIYLRHFNPPNESLTMRLGDNQTSTFIAGIAATAVNGGSVTVATNGLVGHLLGSERDQRDILPLGDRATRMHELRPVTFAYREDATGAMRYGLIAEEVAVLYPELVTRTTTGEVQTVRYEALISLLLHELQRQERTLRDQEQAVERQQRELGALRVLVGAVAWSTR
jgi:hypothetical protein